VTTASSPELTSVFVKACHNARFSLPSRMKDPADNGHESWTSSPNRAMRSDIEGCQMAKSEAGLPPLNLK
jgi:hypothetical protein